MYFTDLEADTEGSGEIVCAERYRKYRKKVLRTRRLRSFSPPATTTSETDSESEAPRSRKCYNI